MEDKKKVLDATCGSRMIWFDKQNDIALFVDKREFDCEAIWKSGNGKQTRYCSIHPDVIADFTNLPFEDESFWHVVFDPPHLTTLGDNSWMCKKYGRIDDWKNTLFKGFSECWRVLKTNGTLIFKWCEIEIPVKEVIEAIGHEPMYGCRSGKQGMTHWMSFVKKDGGACGMSIENGITGFEKRGIAGQTRIEEAEGE